jgi:hypothetical protein
VGFRQPLRRWLRQRRFVQRALATPPDPALQQRRSKRVVVGLLLLGLSYLVCWPAITALAAVAAWLGQPKLLLGGPVLYGVSWLLFLVALALLGSKSVSGGRALVRKLAERFLRE